MAERNPEERRFRVILVDLPAEGPEGLARVLPRPRLYSHDELPVLVRVTHDREAAETTAGRLHDAGAVVVVAEEWGDEYPFCLDHPAELVSEVCERCGQALCARCMLHADGRRLCSRHRHTSSVRSRWIRMRQLLVILIFGVFLTEVIVGLRHDRDAVAPNSTITVGVYQFVPPSDLHHRTVRGLNARPLEGYSGPSLLDLQAWYDGEYYRYTGIKRPYLALDIRGPFGQTIVPPDLAGPDDGALQIIWRSLGYVRYWRKLARTKGLEFDDYAARIFIGYTAAEGDVAAHSRGSETGRLGIAWIDLEEFNPAYAVITIAHELAHTLGASDRYDDGTYRAVFPEGYMEPFKEPLYPQRYAELMAVDIPLDTDVEVEPRDLSQVRIGHATAAELGWLSPSAAEYFYRNEGLSPGERLIGEPEEDGP